MAMWCYAGGRHENGVESPSGMTGWWPGNGNTNDIVGGRNAVLRDHEQT
jgi:hypothetical protein